MHFYCPQTPILLVGTKKDIHDIIIIDKRSIDTLKKDIGAVNFQECSAITQEGIRDVFDDHVDQTLAGAGCGEVTKQFLEEYCVPGSSHGHHFWYHQV